MSHGAIIRAWKDPVYRRELDPSQYDPAQHPAGAVATEETDPAGGDAESTWAPVATTWPCLAIVSAGVSCSGCETTLWKGTCGASSVGCC